MTDDLTYIPPETNCSVHERCIWKLDLEGAKRNADTAIRRMENAEIENAKLRYALEVVVNSPFGYAEEIRGIARKALGQ